MDRSVRVEVLRPGDPRIAGLVEAFAVEWPAWAASVTRREIEAGFESAPGGALPRVFVADAGGEAVGTIALRAWFAEEPLPETPWVRGLWVAPAWRGRGVDRLLGQAVERAARSLGHGRLHAATTRIEPLLRRRGWTVFRHVLHDGAPMAWLVKALA